MNHSVFLSTDMTIKDAALFYPCSASDWQIPIKTFAPTLRDFWFVDTGYFAEEDAASVEPVLQPSDGFQLIDVEVKRDIVPLHAWLNDAKYNGIAPCLRSETYFHNETGRQIVVHRHRRRGPTALRTLPHKLGVFFYRGDSDEGGSGTLWLTVRKWHQPKYQKRRWLIHEVLEKLADGGFIVTDGSLCKGEHNPYRYFRTVAGKYQEEIAFAFEDDAGRRFECVGSLGQHNGQNTLVWRVHQPPAQSDTKG